MSANTGPIAEVFSPFCPNATPAATAISRKVPSLLVVQQKVLGLVVGDIDIGITVEIEIGGRDAHGAALQGARFRLSSLASVKVPSQLLCSSTLVSAG